MKYSDIVASLSLVTAIVIGILNYMHTKRSVRNALSPYLTLRLSITHEDRGIHCLEVEIQNLHNQITVESVHLKPTCFAYIFPRHPERITNKYFRQLTLLFLDRTKWFTSSYSFGDFSGQNTDIIKPGEKLKVALPLLENQDFWIKENILQKANGQLLVKGTDIKKKSFSWTGYPHINFDIALSYVPAVYPIISRTDIYKYTVTAIGDKFPSGKLIEWSITKRDK